MSRFRTRQLDLLLSVLFYHLRLSRWYQIHGDDDAIEAVAGETETAGLPC